QLLGPAGLGLVALALELEPAAIEQREPLAGQLRAALVLALLALQLVAAAQQLADPGPLGLDHGVDRGRLGGGRVLGRAAQRTGLALAQIDAVGDQIADRLQPPKAPLGLVEGELGPVELDVDPPLLGASMVALEDQLGPLELDRLVLRAAALGSIEDGPQLGDPLAAALERLLTVTQIGEASPLGQLLLALVQPLAGLVAT